ncbi:Nif11 family protein [Parasynechococcus sp.]|jgi:predicted ribosomally synthesized peptide with nif11-like leader|uniref:Nif11 family protein n=1 Tax=Parasynechococcus sp. TaxID=3101203 RepID=UPI0037036DEC
MSMKQLETFMSRVKSNDGIREEVQRCGKDNSCVVKVAAKHGHKFSPASLTRWQRDHN